LVADQNEEQQIDITSPSTTESNVIVQSGCETVSRLKNIATLTKWVYLMSLESNGFEKV